MLCCGEVLNNISPTSFRVSSLALGQSYDCPSANEATLKDMAKYIPWIIEYNRSITSIHKYNRTTIKQSMTKQCANIKLYTVACRPTSDHRIPHNIIHQDDNYFTDISINNCKCWYYCIQYFNVSSFASHTTQIRNYKLWSMTDTMYQVLIFTTLCIWYSNRVMNQSGNQHTWEHDHSKSIIMWQAHYLKQPTIKHKGSDRQLRRGQVKFFCFFHITHANLNMVYFNCMRYDTDK